MRTLTSGLNSIEVIDKFTKCEKLNDKIHDKQRR